MWKTNRNAPGATIFAARPILGAFSPTRLDVGSSTRNLEEARMKSRTRQLVVMASFVVTVLVGVAPVNAYAGDSGLSHPGAQVDAKRATLRQLLQNPAAAPRIASPPRTSTNCTVLMTRVPVGTPPPSTSSKVASIFPTDAWAVGLTNTGVSGAVDLIWSRTGTGTELDRYRWPTSAIATNDLVGSPPTTRTTCGRWAARERQRVPAISPITTTASVGRWSGRHSRRRSARSWPACRQ